MSISKDRLIIKSSTPFQTAYSQKLSEPVFFPEVSPVTKQSFKDECDINVLMARYESTGQLPNLNEVAPQYLDCTGQEFNEHMNFIAGAKSLFAELPARIRSRFENDPAQFLDFCSAEKNRPELAEMGLLKPVEEWVQVEPLTAPVMPPVEAPPVNP